MDRKWWTLGVVCAATFMLLLDVTIVVVAVPDIQAALGAGFTQLQWVTDAYALALAALLLTAGSVSDRVGRRRVFVVGLVVFTLGSLLCGTASDAAVLIASRAVQGLGGAMLFATSLALLAHSFHGRERGVAFGAWGAVTGIATALGPILGGLITTGISWRGIFLVNLPIGVAALAVALVRVDESRSHHPRRLDPAGMVTFTGGLVALVYALVEGGATAWGDVEVIVAFVLAAVLLGGFVAVELRTPDPMVDLRLMRIPSFVGGSIAAFAMNGSLFAMLLYLVIYLQEGLGYSALETGVRLLLMSGATMLVSIASGRLSARIPARWLIGPGLALVGVGLLLMTGLTAGSSWTHLIPGLLVAGVGSGLVNPPLAATAVGVVPLDRSGMASGFNNTCRQVGIAVGIAVYGALFAAHLTAGAGGAGSGGAAQGSAPAAPAALAALADAMNVLFVAGALVAVVGGICALVLIRPRDFIRPGGSPATATPAAGTTAAGVTAPRPR